MKKNKKLVYLESIFCGKFIGISIFLLFLFACVSTNQQEQREVENKKDKFQIFDEFVFDQASSVVDDARFRRILELREALLEYQKQAKRMIVETIQLRDALELLLSTCPLPENSTPYIVSASIVEPSDVAYYQKSIYACEYYLTDSEIALTNGRNQLNFLDQITRDVERTLIWIQRECEIRGMAEEYRYILQRQMDIYVNQINERDIKFSKWLKDVEQFAMDYIECMKSTSN